jgi:hypothetical protein
MSALRQTRPRLVLAAWAATALVATAAIGAVAPAGAAPAAASCPPISAAQLRTILGLPQSLQTRNTVSEGGGADHYQCNGVAWSGSKPTSFAASMQKARSGNGAGFGIEAWTPNEGSPDADKWPRRYDELTGDLEQGLVIFPGFVIKAGWVSKRFTPSRFGNDAMGVVTRPKGVAKGLVAAVGCWWNDNALSAVCLMVEEAVGKPVVKHLNQLAAIAVPKIL